MKLKQVLFFVVFLKKKQLFVFKKMGDSVKLEQNGIVDSTDDGSGNNVSSDVDVDNLKRRLRFMLKIFRVRTR